MKPSTKDALVKLICSFEVPSRVVQQGIFADSAIACNVQTAAVKHKSQTRFLLTATSHCTVQSNNQGKDLLVVGFATATDPYRTLGLHL